jgi:hypothetical protein
MIPKLHKHCLEAFPTLRATTCLIKQSKHDQAPGENTIVGSGAVVAKSLPANCTAVGIPAKPIKFHIEN